MATGMPTMPEASVGDEYRLLLQRGHAVEPLDSARLRRRFPPWTAEHCLACGYISGGEVLMSERVALAWNDKPTHPTCSMPMTFTSMQ